MDSPTPPATETPQSSNAPRRTAKETFFHFHGKWKRFLRFLSYGLPLALVTAFGLLVYAVIKHEPWPYLIDAYAGEVQLWPSNASPTVVPLDGAVLCLRRAAIGDLPVREGGEVCTGRWVELALELGPESMLEISQQADGAELSVTHDRDGSFRMMVGAGGQATLMLTGDSSAQIGSEAIVVFRPESGESFARTVVVPFQGRFGAGVLLDSQGRARDGLIRSGAISVFGHSDDNASGRRALDEFVLLTGDRVEVSSGRVGTPASATGYFEMQLTKPMPDAVPPGIRLVATGFVEGLKVERPGNATISLEPSFWARLVRHSAITTWVTAILAIFGLMAVYREASELGLPND